MELLEQNGDAKANKGPVYRFRVLFSEQKRGYEGKGPGYRLGVFLEQNRDMKERGPQYGIGVVQKTRVWEVCIWS